MNFHKTHGSRIKLNTWLFFTKNTENIYNKTDSLPDQKPKYHMLHNFISKKNITPCNIFKSGWYLGRSLELAKSSRFPPKSWIFRQNSKISTNILEFSIDMLVLVMKLFEIFIEVFDISIEIGEKGGNK